MTRPEGIVLGFTIVVLGMLAAVTVFATAIVMLIRLSNLRHTLTGASEMLQERRSIVAPSLVVMGAASGLWVIMLALDIWWTLVQSVPFERMFHRL